ncbi:MAG: Na(+)/H(+) antiporter subunit B [Deltaproteobacteria bacterium]|nr:Na(+)/H(+) antiporter subunit B [Deltaproteobacteria bacterium]MCF8120737.1 Na(+)/H(+) antiporter subunit B [Deltaproteobacteria bacterium]
MIQKSDDVIVRTVARSLMPFILIYGLYVVMHGHYSPGGGFQGGVILAAGFVLLTVTQGIERTRQHMSQKTACVISSVGLLIYAGIGALCLILGGRYLDYGRLSQLLQVDQPTARSLGILGVEIGVALGVMAVMCIIFFSIFAADETE